MEFLNYIKSFGLEELNQEKFKSQTSRLIDDLEQCELPFSTDFSDPDGCQKLREFLIRSKDAKTLTPSTELSEMIYIKQNLIRHLE